MINQLKWLQDIVNKKPKEYHEYFYFDIYRYLNLDFTDDTKDINDLFTMCGGYAKTLLICKNKLEVKKWIDEVAIYASENIEVEYLIESWFNNKLTR